jgi:hypothetical protein
MNQHIRIVERVGALDEPSAENVAGFKTGILLTLLATWGGAASGYYLAGREGDGAMWGSIIGGLVAAGAALTKGNKA